MRTTTSRALRLIALSIASFIAVLSTPVRACSATEVFYTVFEENSTTMSNSEILRLANWVVDQKIAYANHHGEESTGSYGGAQAGEHNLLALAEARAKLGVKLLTQMNFMRGETYTQAAIYTSNWTDQGASLAIEFLPDCPNKCGPCEPRP